MIGREFMAVAIQLRTTNSEATNRTRIGRAYYAAFLEARQLAQDHLDMPANHTSGSHGAVANVLASHDAQLQVDLGLLRRMRNGADYDLQLTPESLRSQADQACILAGSIIARLDQTRSSLDAFGSSRGRREQSLHIISRDEHLTQMDKLAAFFPDSQVEQDAVSLILLSYPQLPGMILRVIAVIEETLPGSVIRLDTRTYDDWDPPLQLLFTQRDRIDDPIAALHRLMDRLRGEDVYDQGLISLQPDW